MTRLIQPTLSDLALDETAVRRYLGWGPGAQPLAALQQQLLADGLRLATAVACPEAAVVDTELIVTGDQVITRSAGLLWQSKSLALMLQRAVRVTILAATLGEGCDTLARQLQDRNEIATATVVDAVCTALVHSLTRHVAEILKEEHTGLTPTPFCSPGYGDWPITDLPALASASRGGEIGLRLTAGKLLRPQKSLIGIVGWLSRPQVSAADSHVCDEPDCACNAQPDEPV